MRRLLLAGSDGVMTDDVGMGAAVFEPFRRQRPAVAARQDRRGVSAAVATAVAATAAVDRGVL